MMMGISSRDLRRGQRLAVRMLRAVPHADAADVVTAVDAHPGHISEMFGGLTPRGDCVKTAAAAAAKRPPQAHAAAALIHPACPPYVLRDMPAERHIKMDRAATPNARSASLAGSLLIPAPRCGQPAPGIPAARPRLSGIWCRTRAAVCAKRWQRTQPQRLRSSLRSQTPPCCMWTSRNPGSGPPRPVTPTADRACCGISPVVSTRTCEPAWR